MTWRMAVPMFAGRGLRNLLSLAEARAAAAQAPVPSATVAASSMHSEEI